MVAPTAPGLDTVTGAGIAVFIIEFLKKRLPWLPGTASRVASALIAAGLAVGIHVTFAGGTLTITGLTLTGIIIGVWIWIKQFTAQEITYQILKGAKSNPAAPPVTAK